MENEGREEAAEPASDFGKLFAEMAKKHAEFTETHGELKFRNPRLGVDDLAFPMTVSTIELRAAGRPADERVGGLVRVRPVDPELKGRTFAGIFLGDLMAGVGIAFGPKSGTLFVNAERNPAIFVPELRRIVWGRESWWAPVTTADEAEKMISDADIADVWYVKLLRELAAKGE